MARLLSKLWKVGLLRPRGLWNLVRSVRSEGMNLMAILNYASLQYGHRPAASDPGQQLDYRALHLRSMALASQLWSGYGLGQGDAVALVARNHCGMVLGLCALSRLGVDVYLLNVEMSGPQLESMLEQQSFKLVLHDPELLASLGHLPEMQRMDISKLGDLAAVPELRLPKRKPGRVILLSGGTSGRFKTAKRKPSLQQVLHPAKAMLLLVEVDRYRSVYIATPLYHGYGLNAFMISALLGLEMHFLPKFEVARACELIRTQKVEGATLVPLMLERMLSHSAEDLKSLRCILSGGAVLPASLAERVDRQLGAVLYNLYGTSEAGFSLLATPGDLSRHPGTLGRPIPGVEVRLQDKDGLPVATGEVGIIALKTKIVMEGVSAAWVPTGDLASCNAEGYYFFKGRNDTMIVSGGENVFPEDVEEVLRRHPDVVEVAAVGVHDSGFGQRLVVFVVARGGVVLDTMDLMAWLGDRVARYQMPKRLLQVEAVPMRATGKVDRRQLLEIAEEMAAD